MIRMLLVDDHSSSREPLAFMLGHEPDMTVVAKAGSVAETRQALAENLDLDIAILDLGLPDGFGTELIGAVHASNPRAVALVLTSFSDKQVLAEAIEAGAAGVMHKSSDVEEIVAAVRKLHSGEQIVSAREVSEAVRLAVAARREKSEGKLVLDSLTPREMDVLQALAEGLTDKEIAERLFVGVGTVRTHVNNVLSKLGVRSKLQALVFAVRHGAVEID
ncbi:MAG: response regulator transcription factor [Rubrobacteraceae bacterium]